MGATTWFNCEGRCSRPGSRCDYGRRQIGENPTWGFCDFLLSSPCSVVRPECVGGLSRLTDIDLGIMIGVQLVGNSNPDHALTEDSQLYPRLSELDLYTNLSAFNSDT
jgi:hypothetical protein